MVSLPSFELGSLAWKSDVLTTRPTGKEFEKGQIFFGQTFIDFKTCIFQKNRQNLTITWISNLNKIKLN